MDNPEDSAWVFDSLVGFLHGPVWNAPLQAFIEEKSCSFEPSDSAELPGGEEYGLIHEEYKSLVDLLLGSYMEEIGISAEQFEAACQLSRGGAGGLPVHFHKRLFQQIWAANDYNMFTRMMVQRNVELQLQALESLERRAAAPAGGEPPEDGVQRLSLGHEPRGAPGGLAEAPRGDTAEQIYKDNTLPKDNFQKTPIKQPTAPTASRSDAEDESRHRTKPPQEDIQQRRAYLKRQRDKLLALKQQERGELGGGGPEHGALAPGPALESVQLRRALAQRLRLEVVDNKMLLQ